MRKYINWLMMAGVLFIILCLPLLLHAQPDPGGDPDAPIDGGLGVLLAAGVGYGVKKMRDFRKNKIKLQS